MTARPVLPSAPPADEVYGGSSGLSSSSDSSSRGTVRPHSLSPFLRNVRAKMEEEEEEEVDIEAVPVCSTLPPGMEAPRPLSRLSALRLSLVLELMGPLDPPSRTS